MDDGKWINALKRNMSYRRPPPDISARLEQRLRCIEEIHFGPGRAVRLSHLATFYTQKGSAIADW